MNRHNVGSSPHGQAAPGDPQDILVQLQVRIAQLEVELKVARERQEEARHANTFILENVAAHFNTTSKDQSANTEELEKLWKDNTTLKSENAQLKKGLSTSDQKYRRAKAAVLQLLEDNVPESAQTTQRRHNLPTGAVSTANQASAASSLGATNRVDVRTVNDSTASRDTQPAKNVKDGSTSRPALSGLRGSKLLAEHNKFSFDALPSADPNEPKEAIHLPVRMPFPVSEVLYANPVRSPNQR